MSEYLIIGNSTAAIHAVEAIRTVDRKGKIVLVSDEPHHTYGRPLISYYLCGRTDRERMKYRPDDWYRQMQVEPHLGIRATELHAEKKQVTLEDGSILPYGKLLVATGSRAFVPPMEGLERVTASYRFMTLSDAERIRQDFCPSDRVLIIGAGLIGLKCLEGIYGRVREIAVVDMADRILPSILDEEGASIVQTYLEKEKGITFYLKDSAASFPESNRVILKSGRSLTFDRLVLAVGVRANTELVKDAGGECAKGILTDDRQRTSLPDVYAAGDCTESYDIASGQRHILALLPNASFQGHTAGLNMAGQEAHFDQAVAMNAMGLFDLHMVTAGVYDGTCYTESRDGNYKKLYCRDNLLKGFLLIGDVARAGIYTSLLRNRIPLDRVDFARLRKEPALAAFSEEYRKEKLTKRV